MTVLPDRRLADALRVLSMDAVQKANSGHPGMPMGMADVATVLFANHLKFDPTDPHWPDRDRFILSAGHGSMLLYALLHLTGYADMTLEELTNFRQLGAKTAGHPEYGHATGIETTTGPLGQGIANATGFALAEAILADRFGSDLVDHHTYVIAGDGDLMEGISQEAISLAGHLKLNKLIVLWDDNGISIDGPVSLSDSTDQLQRFAASGWETLSIDGHDMAAIDAALTQAKTANKPVLIACKTTIGYGAPTKQGTSATHGAPLGDEEIAGTRAALGWSHGPFVLPEDIRLGWQAIGARGAAVRAQWQARLKASPQGDDFTHQLAHPVPEEAFAALADHAAKMAADKPAMATRASSGKALDAITPKAPAMIGGSADLTGSNNTKAGGMPVIAPGKFSGQFLHYGIREHGMAAAMNGMALHGGLVPYSGTFLVFSDYCRPSIRLSALMQQRVIYVMTHDSIGLGEDGPTHQPVEHLAALRAIPNLLVMRPADAVEVAECWEVALRQSNRPTVLALSRQKTPALRDRADTALTARGGYVLHDTPQDLSHQVTLIGTGTELQLAVAARETLANEGIGARIVSMPCLELFFEQPTAYQDETLGHTPVVVVEAGMRQGWDALIGRKGGFVGMSGFGASAPAEALYEHFGITAKAVVEAAKAAL